MTPGVKISCLAFSILFLEHRSPAAIKSGGGVRDGAGRAGRRVCRSCQGQFPAEMSRRRAGFGTHAASASAFPAYHAPAPHPRASESLGQD
ncbi:hypothetical protein SKAU_G00002580 [Synaphobranchus kaupii]|uniref:Secreted protein n=1 Tax=Synaphobranchus kaupii TaxID=118154 RepID=A0A9Q1G9G0_SYNKA|nr:hypothetical protein SKAU_G00002580 [Synaphobranchus kaupii]